MRIGSKPAQPNSRRDPRKQRSGVDHVGFAVSNYDRSKAFYETALAPLGMTLIMEPAGAAAGFGKSGKPTFWIEAQGTPVHGRLHIALGRTIVRRSMPSTRPHSRRQ
jgi:catechol 2,3-dioxygenase-like lactoylglutathione lyase family enzyme